MRALGQPLRIWGQEALSPLRRHLALQPGYRALRRIEAELVRPMRDLQLSHHRLITRALIQQGPQP